jgi:hypothetical protein
MAQPWPAPLQDFFSEQNFQIVMDDATLRSDIDVGPQKVRRRFTKGIDIMSASIYLTTSEYSIFETFFKTTLAGGTLPFEFNHPVTGILTEFRFREKPRIGSLGGGQFTVSFDLEVLP